MMPRERFCKVCRGWHDPDNWPHNCSTVNWNRSDLAAPSVISDCMDGVQSMLDGKMYDSKSALRATYRAAGVTEVGNDAVTERKDTTTLSKKDDYKRGLQKSIGTALSQAGFGA